MQVRAKQASRQEYARQRWLRGCGAVCSGRGRERAEGGEGPVLRVRRCAAAVCPGWDSWDWASVVLGEFGWTRC